MAVLRTLVPLALLAAVPAQSPTAVVGLGPFRVHSDWSRGCVAVAAGTTGAVLATDGTIRVFGQWPSGTFDVPALPAGTTYVDVEVSYGSVLALRSDQTIVVWGNNWSGEANVPPPPPGLHYARLASCNGSSCVAAFLSDGTLVEWGTTYPGGTTAPPLPPGLQWTKVARNGYHALGLRSDGSAVAWGTNFWGQGNLPALPPGVTWVDVAVTNNHSALVRSDGTAVVLGNNPPLAVPPPPPGTSYVEASGCNMTVAFRRSDDGVVVLGYAGDDYGQSFLPSPRPGTSYSRVEVGDRFVLALRSDGVVVGAGKRDRGQTNVPVDVDFVSVQPTGSWTHVGLRRDGSIATWGYYWPNYASHAGQPWVFDPPPLPAGATYTSVATGLQYALALRSDGQVVGFGIASNGIDQIPPLPPGRHYTGVGAGEYHAFVLRDDGALVAFGFNSAGQCNVPALPPGTRYVAADASERCSIALRSDGQLVAFGDTAAFGQGLVPALPAGLLWRSVSLGQYHTVALRSDGELIAWGHNGAGQCNVPALPPGVHYVEAAAAITGRHTLARRSDGVVVAFGNNAHGQCTIPALPPDQGWLGLGAGEDLSALRRGAPSTCIRVGVGCAGTLAAAAQIPSDTPCRGRPFAVEFTRLPLDLAIVATGLDLANSSFGPLPLDLAALGLPGCTLHTSLDVLQFVVGASGSARREWAIPDDPFVLGIRFRQQALVVDPGAGNSLGIVLSDAVEGRVGG